MNNEVKAKEIIASYSKYRHLCNGMLIEDITKSLDAKDSEHEEEIKKLNEKHDYYYAKVDSLEHLLAEKKAECERLKVDPQERPMFLEEISSLKSSIAKMRETLAFISIHPMASYDIIQTAKNALEHFNYE